MTPRPACDICASGAPRDALAEFDASIVTVPANIDAVDRASVVSRLHVSEPFDLPGLNRRRYWEELLHAARALSDVTAAAGIDFAIQGRTSPHLHTTLSARGPSARATREMFRAALETTLPSPPSRASSAPGVYDEMSEWFEAQAGTGFYNAHYDRPAVLALCGDVTGLRIAELGCGPGYYLAELRDRGADVVGVDGSVALLERARARVGPDIALITHDLELPLTMFTDESLDGVVMALVYHHVDNRSGLLREVRRTLRPDGWLVLSTSHPVADWLHSGGSYFTVERTDLTFDASGGGWQVPVWRMPMMHLLDEVLGAGFVVERLVEPTPPADRAALDPRLHQRLIREPAFVVVRARRQE